jgi:hypothetical protein
MYSGFAWQIIMVSGLDDWIYWHFFTITVNYDSSQSMTVSDLLHCLLEHERLLFHCDEWRITAHVLNCLERCLSDETRKSVFSDLLPNNDSFVAIRYTWNVITEPLLSNGRPLRLQYSSFQTVFTEPLPSSGLFRHSILGPEYDTVVLKLVTHFVRTCQIIYCPYLSPVYIRSYFTFSF